MAATTSGEPAVVPPSGTPDFVESSGGEAATAARGLSGCVGLGGAFGVLRVLNLKISAAIEPELLRSVSTIDDDPQNVGRLPPQLAVN